MASMGTTGQSSGMIAAAGLQPCTAVDNRPNERVYGDTVRQPGKERSMPVEQLTSLTIAAAARAFRARQLSPVELTRACLERIDALDGRPHAFVTLLLGRAL